MKTYQPVLVIGIIEILIGGLTLLTTFLCLVCAVNQKTPNVLVFVIVTGIMSTAIGIGLLTFRKMAYDLLIYFSSVIILSKFLILVGILQLSGGFNSILPTWLQSWISILYHGTVIFYLVRNETKILFHTHLS